MEKDIKLGNVGDVDIQLAGGVATVSLSASVPGNYGVSGGAFVKCDAGQLIDKLFAAIEAKLPANAMPIEETVKTIIKQAVAAIQ